MIQLSNRMYDILKTIAWVVAPILTFIGTLCVIWGVPYSTQITATLAAINTLLGAYIKTANYQYTKPLPVDMSGLKYLEDDEITPEEDAGIIGEAKDVM